jgi:hypothetical protein
MAPATAEVCVVDGETPLKQDVCFWRKADMLNKLTNVRIWGQSGQ